MSEPVFSSTCYTGQPQTDKEEVLCPVCQDKDRLVTLRAAGWYDPYIENPHIDKRNDRFFERRMGLYVHYGCLSEKRKNELRKDGYKFN